MLTDVDNSTEEHSHACCLISSGLCHSLQENCAACTTANLASADAHGGLLGRQPVHADKQPCSLVGSNLYQLLSTSTE